MKERVWSEEKLLENLECEKISPGHLRDTFNGSQKQVIQIFYFLCVHYRRMIKMEKYILLVIPNELMIRNGNENARKVLLSKELSQYHQIVFSVILFSFLIIDYMFIPHIE